MLRREHIECLPVNLMVPHYLAAAYCYYVCDQSPMTDDAFDRLCMRMLEHWDDIEHMHKKIINVGDLEAGTCLLGSLEYPLRVQIGAAGYLQRCQNGQMVKDLGLDAPARPSGRRIPTARPSTQVATRRVAAVRRPAPQPVEPPAEEPAQRPTGVRRVVRRRP